MSEAAGTTRPGRSPGVRVVESDTDAVLAELGYPDAEVAALRARGVVA